MNPARVDFAVDLVYGLLIFASIVLIVVIGTQVGVAFGLGVLASYVVHVVWKMARFDPDWMTREVAEEVTDEVEETVAQEVTEEVEQTVSQEVDEVIGQLEEINERVDRRPKTEEVEERVEELTGEGGSADSAGGSEGSR